VLTLPEIIETAFENSRQYSQNLNLQETSDLTWRLCTDVRGQRLDQFVRVRVTALALFKERLGESSVWLAIEQTTTRKRDAFRA
jgi:hypothetical protein